MNPRDRAWRSLFGALLLVGTSLASAAAVKADALTFAFVHETTTGAAEPRAAAAGLTVIERWPAVGVVVVAGTPAALRALAAAAPGLRIEPSQPVQFYLDSAHRATRAELARDPAARLGDRRTKRPYDGTGITIAINDTGIDGTHPAFVENGVSKVVRNLRQACAEDGAGCGQWVELANTDPDDGHGTAVAGVAAGYERVAADGRVVRGVAPGARLVGLGQNVLSPTTMHYGLLSGLHWVLEHHADPCGDGRCPPVRVVSNSWGPLDACVDNTFDPESAAAKLTTRLVEAGIVVTYAIGNGSCFDHGALRGGGDGTDNRVLYLAAHPLPGVIGVANYDDADAGNPDHALYFTSSRGLRRDPTTYPDLAAPGTLVQTACGITQQRCLGGGTDPHYAAATGTSFSSPYVAGAAALLLQADAALSPAQVERLLENTAHRFGPDDYVADPRNPDHPTSYDRGHGLVDVAAALAAVTKQKAPADSSGPAFIVDGGLSYRFTPLPERATGVVSPEGCETEAGAALGALGPAGAPGSCHTASQGWLGFNTDLFAEFTSAPLARTVTVGGTAAIVAYIADPLRPATIGAATHRSEYWLDALAPDGTVTALSAGETLHGMVDGRNDGSFLVTPVEVPAGQRLRLRLRQPGVTTTAKRLLYGGTAYGDAGLTLPVGHFETGPGRDPAGVKSAPEGSGVVVGSFGRALLAVLLLAFGAGRRRNAGAGAAWLFAAVLAGAPAPAHAATFLSFTPDPARAGAPSPEGCHVEPGLAQGFLTGSSTGDPCHTGSWGTAGANAFAGDAGASGEAAATFTTGVLGAPLEIAGPMTLVVYFQNEEPGTAAVESTVFYALDELRAGGEGVRIDSGTALRVAGGTYINRQQVTLAVPAHTVAAGNRLRFSLAGESPTGSSGRLVYGGEYSDAGITLGGGGGGGVLPLAALAPLVSLAWVRRRRQPS